MTSPDTSPDATREVSRLDRLILQVHDEEGGGCLCDLVVADDPDGALTDAALDHLAESSGAQLWRLAPTVAQARETEARASGRGLRDRVRIAGIDGPLEVAAFLEGAEPCFVLTHLPAALAALDHLARSVAAAAGPQEARIFIGGANTKHMTRRQNEMLVASFEEVRASRGSGKFRCLVAAGPRPDAPAPQPLTSTIEAGTLHGVGAVFGGASEDHGGTLLAAAAADLLRERLAAGDGEDDAAPTVLDLGCGNGQVTLQVLHALGGAVETGAATPPVRVVATDHAADAVLSARLTLEALIRASDGTQVEVTWDDAASRVPGGSVDLVLLNPPFHAGSAVDATLVGPLLDAAARVLRSGGTLLLVHNSHLRYRQEVRRRFTRAVGSPPRITQVTRDRRFTVLRADLLPEHTSQATQATQPAPTTHPTHATPNGAAQ